MNAVAGKPRFLMGATVFWLISLACVGRCSGGPLHTAIEKGATQRALRLISQGKHINERQYRQEKRSTYTQTPLYCAAFRGQDTVVGALLDAGADTELEEEIRGKVPLHAAAATGNAAIARRLIAMGADVDARCDSGATPLIEAAGYGHGEVVGVLISGGAEVNAQDENGTSGISFASSGGHLPVVQALVASGAQVNIKAKGGITPLMNAAAAKHADVVAYLIQTDADVNGKSDSGMTALMFAACAGDVNCVTVLVRNGAELDTRCADPCWTALHFAAYSDHVKVVDYLIDRGASIDTVAEGERDFYVMGVVSKLLARHHDDKGDRQGAIQYYARAGEYYEKAATGFKDRSREIGGKIASARLMALGRFAATVAVSAVASGAIGTVGGGSSATQVIVTPTGVPSAGTGDLSSLKKDCDRRVKESNQCADGCRQLVEYYQNDASGKAADKRLKGAKEKLGFL